MRSSLSLIVSLPLFLPAGVAAGVPAEDPCQGCALDGAALLDEHDAAARHDCPAPGTSCFIVWWSTVSGFTETCDGFGDCTELDCSFTWKMKYKTSGCTSVTDFIQTPTSPTGSPIRRTPSGSAVTAERVDWESRCGNNTERSGSVAADDTTACGNLSFDYDFTVGCDACNE